MERSVVVSPREEQIRIDGQIVEQVSTVGSGEGHAVRVTIIQGGRSKNGYVYDETALRQIAQLIEGAQAYADHARSGEEQVNRSVRDVVGFYQDAAYVAQGDGGRVDATLHIFEAADWLWSMIKEACDLGRPELIGLSIDIFGQWQLNEASKAKEITSVVQLNSCDVVTRPSAGGSFRRILHHDDTDNHDNEICYMTLQGEYEHMTITPEKIEEATQSEASGEAIQTQAQAQQQIEQQRREVERLLNEVHLQKANLLLERRLQESILPEAARSQVRQRLQGRLFEEQELESEISSAQTLLAQLSRDGLIRGHGHEKATISGMVTEAEKVQAAFDAMFGLDIDTGKLGNVRGFISIHEAYSRVTGDSSLRAGISSGSHLGPIQVAESAPIGRVSEADTTTASFSYLLGTSMNKRLLKDYEAWPAEWQKFASVIPIKDFKQQTRVRLGAFGSLPIVAEDTPYSAVTLSDSAATYVPQKRGNLVTISRETILNDDLQAIRQIPSKLAVAAAYTLAEFVYSFLSTNPVIYDTANLFTTGAPHNNLGAAALSTTAMQNGITAMREQSNYAGKRLGLRPRYLVVPPELEWTSMVVTKSAGVPGSPNNDINPMLGYVTPIVAPQLSSSTQWFLLGDPREVDTIEIGFVGGQVNPSLFIQDQPMVGLNFTQDAINYKIRHEYGGAVVDYRGIYRGI
ncbi:phage major capsid protein [Dictyobacter aurantiacus]|uniref:phage major capsid protein n=1 Tax=Dictyobacter aurantiacus TaxID=1936993 RepID=UPI0010C7D793|nr:Mu-like prophage major head subunit gpT family protein [Dictyobacter aurantiacus]